MVIANIEVGEMETLTIKEVEKALRLNRRTLLDLAKSGALPRIKIGRTVRYRKADILRRLTADAAVEACV